MPYRIDIYIGSDNGSRRIHDDYMCKVMNWANGIFPGGYTIMRGQGCYHGIAEDSLLINVVSNSDIPLKEQLQRLKRELEQEAIMLVKAPVDIELI